MPLTPFARGAGLALAAVLSFGGLGSPTAAVAAPAPVTTPCPEGTPLEADFNGDGRPELVIGADEGWTAVGNGDDTSAWTLARTGGRPLRSVDLNGDTCADAVLGPTDNDEFQELAIGTPAGLALDAIVKLAIPQADWVDGILRTLYLQASAIRHDGLSQVVVAGTKWEDESAFGWFLDVFTLDSSLTVVGTQVFDYPDGDSLSLATSGATVAVGEPYVEVKGSVSAGKVRLYTPDSTDPSKLALRTVLTQNSRGVPGTVEAGDLFGGSLAFRDGRLAIGAPGESSGRIRNADLVQPILWHEATHTYAAYRSITQDTPGVPGADEKNDRFGTDVAVGRGITAPGSYDVVIGAEESIGSRKYAGSVTVANFTRKLYRGFTQATDGIPGNPQAGDDFCQVGILRGANGVDTVMIGAPGEDSNGIEDVGRVIRSNGTKLTSRTVWTNIAVPPGLRMWGLTVGAGN
ncbi:MAG: VCBS repeat-containing protein [Actinobacteria bacterium]|nr:VCBS repeat-containing protein [Actinomycetota bacterium]